MSIIRVDNFGPSSGGTTYSARGIAKSWLSLNGTGTIAIRASLNVSSVTDYGVGSYGMSFTNAFSAADYSVTGGGDATADGFAVGLNVTLPTTTEARLSVVRGGLGVGDYSYVCWHSLGDLA